ncbi:MAG: tetratricopeptide repeat protein [Nitrososphaerales archaeon]
MLASIYEYGGAHVSQDYAKAKELYERAWNEWRLVLAAQKLGRFYYHGHGVKADYDRAFYYYSKLENSIDAVGLLSLGWLYETGRGVTSDINRARDLYRRSARLGNIQARKHWGFLEIKHGHPVFGIILWAWAIVEGVLAAFIKAKHGRLQSY